MTAHGFTQAFQSVNFEVREFLERSLRLDTLLQSLADKLNSNEEFNPQRGFEVLLSVIAMPNPGSGKRKHNPGRRCLEKTLKKKQSVITIKNQDTLCCARAIETKTGNQKLTGNSSERDILAKPRRPKSCIAWPMSPKVLAG